jgi:hypothetical protein
MMRDIAVNLDAVAKREGENGNTELYLFLRAVSGRIREAAGEIERLTERGMEAIAWCEQLGGEIERLQRENEDLTDFIKGVAGQLLKRARAGQVEDGS